MADINSLFGGGGMTLNTNGGLAGGIGGGGDADFFKMMAARKMQQDAEDRARRQEREDFAFAQAKNASRGPALQGEEDPDMRDLKRAQIQDEIRKANASKRPMLQPNIQMGNTGVAYQLDPNSMNAYQRKNFLPGGSEMKGDINDTLGAGTIGYGHTGGFTPGGVQEARNKNQGELEKPDLDQGANTRADWYGLQTHRPRPDEEDEQQQRRR
jgi:hypothetical protein